MRFLVNVVASRNLAGRYETYQGRKHLVVPVVGLVEGVVHAMNAQHPELVPAIEFSKSAATWAGRPIFIGHPMDANGSPISGNSPAVYEKRVGTVFNPNVKDKKLTMEAWVDVERAEAAQPGIVKTLEDLMAEISVGTLVSTDDSEGYYGTTKYRGTWHDIMSDHLAILKPGDVGACSRKMGCGVRAAQRGAEDEMNEQQFYAELFGEDLENIPELKTLRNIPQSERDKLPAGDFAGPHQSFPIQKPEDVAAAAHSLGRAKGDTNAIKAKIIAIAYRKGGAFVDNLPDAWKKSKDQKNASAFARIMQNMRELFTEAGVQMGELSEEEIRDAIGKRHNYADQQKVQTMHDTSVALGADCSYRAAAKGSCGCKGDKPAKSSKW